MPAHTDRLARSKMYRQIISQVEGRTGVEFIVLLDNGPMSTGKKMDELYKMARGRYVAGVGDDDIVADDYVGQLVAAIEEHSGVDVISFDHDYYVNGKFRGHTKVSAKFVNGYDEETSTFYRRVTPKCAVRNDICKSFTHPHKSDGEDEAFSKFFSEDERTEFRLLTEHPLYTHLWDTYNKEWRREQCKKWNRR